MLGIATTILGGYLVKDPEAKQTKNGSMVTFSVAVNGANDHVSFFNVTAFKKAGEIALKYLKKGDGVIVEGKLHQSRWEDEGGKKSAISITAYNITFLPKGEKKQGTPAGSGDYSLNHNPP